MITATPARILEVSDKKGSLVAGKDADIVIFNTNIEIDTTIIRGRIVYSKSRHQE
jgi:N-acetylglucosamine-6-phosphate deacetylase